MMYTLGSARLPYTALPQSPVRGVVEPRSRTATHATAHWRPDRERDRARSDVVPTPTAPRRLAQR